MIRVQPMVEPLDRTVSFYDQIGGEQGLKELVDRFYDLMDLESDFKELRDTHGESLDNAREKLFLFLSGYLGGPDRYISQFGHPRLKARHMPFSIGSVERDQWVICMGRAMMDQNIPEPIMDRMLQSFYGVADWMRNRDD
ncbi:group II truncated hemoglobin [Advenella sp. RU8]|uniref:group II truncated hemoglobin n=1 Tax=Advenella sp. RU8 TaxID=3399575 RepID=UPI003AAF81BE